jgi:hypothetical protein
MAILKSCETSTLAARGRPACDDNPSSSTDSQIVIWGVKNITIPFCSMDFIHFAMKSAYISVLLTFEAKKKKKTFLHLRELQITFIL